LTDILFNDSKNHIMKIILAHTYFINEDPLEQKVMKPYPPLGILYLSSWLKKHNKNVQVFDSTFSNREKMYAFLEKEKPDILGIHCNMMTKFVVLELIDYCKKNNIISILGGPDAATQIDEFLTYGADIIISGEGEETLLAVINHLEKKDKNSLHEISNVSFKDQNEKIISTSRLPSKKQLDSFPFPDRSSIDLELYLEAWQKLHGQRSISIVTARGCAFTCKWCSHSVYGFTHRRRKPEKVIEELKTLLPKYKPTHLWYVDDVFTVNKHWLKHYARLLKEEKIYFPFECIARGDRIDIEIVEILKEMGCYRIWFGAESGSQKILDAMSRGVTKKQIEQAVILCREAGIESGLFVMFGYPGETIADINETIQFISAIQPDNYLTTIAYPLRGTKLFDEKMDDVIYEQDWSHTIQRDLDIKGRFKTDLYDNAIQKLACDYQRVRLSQLKKDFLKQIYFYIRAVFYSIKITLLKNSKT